MAFMLGGFADGLFKGASQAIQLYGMYHNVREQQADSEARDAYAEAMKTPTPSALPTGDATANLPASPEETAAAPAETTTTDPNATPARAPVSATDLPPPKKHPETARQVAAQLARMYAAQAVPSTPPNGSMPAPATLTDPNADPHTPTTEAVPTTTATPSPTFSPVSPSGRAAGATTVNPYDHIPGREQYRAEPKADTFDTGPGPGAQAQPAGLGQRMLQALSPVSSAQATPASAPAADPNAITTVRSQVEANALPPGSRYILPDNTPGRVPPAGAQAAPPASAVPAPAPAGAAPAAPAAPTAPADTSGTFGSSAPAPSDPMHPERTPPTEAEAASAIPATPNVAAPAPPGAGPPAGTPAVPAAPTRQGVPTTTTPAAAAPVTANTPLVPNQQGPTNQSETSPGVVQPPISQHAWQTLMQHRPEDAAIVKQIADEAGITPDRLAAHWLTESGLRQSSPNGTSGEVGIMQIMPYNSKGKVAPDGHPLDPTNWQDSLRLGAMLIRKGDDAHGQNTPGSVLAYMRGDKYAHSLATDFESNSKLHPQAMGVLTKMFDDAKLSAANFSPAGTTTAGGIVEAFYPHDPAAPPGASPATSPSGAVSYIAQTGPRNLGMTDLMRYAESKMVEAAILRHDYAGAQHAREMMFQMSQQGTTSNLMAAHQAMTAGDGVGAAQALARAHAFFPDSSMGKFSVDAKGGVWAQRFDERDPSKPIGGPFQITPQALLSQMMQTRDPAAYVKMVTDQQTAVAHQRSLNANASYHEQLPDIMLERTKEASAARVEAARLRSEAQVAAAQTRAQAQATALTQRKDAVVDETNKVYQDPNGPYANWPADQRATASQIYADIRHTTPDNAATGAHAQYVADNLATGKFSLNPDARNADGSFKVIHMPDARDPTAQKAPTVVGAVSPAVAAHIAQRHIAGATPLAIPAGATPNPVGAGAGTSAAMMNGPQGLGGGPMPNNSALPPPTIH